MLDFLQTIVKTTTLESGLVVTALPYMPTKARRTFREIAAAHGDVTYDWPVNMSEAFIIDARTVDVQASDDAQPVAQAIAAWWSQRPASFDARIQFYEALPPDLFSAWYDAVDAATIEEAATDIPPPPPEGEAGAAGGSSTTNHE